MRPGVAEKIVPVVTHGVENGIVELNWARDEQSGVGCLGGHDGLVVLVSGGQVVVGSCSTIGRVWGVEGRFNV